MKKYEELTGLGKKRRMNKIACDALKEYEMDVKSVAYLTEETNTFFKVSDFSGKKYALKIFQEESSKLEDNLAEIFLLGQVRTNSDIAVPEVVLDREGRGIVTIRRNDMGCEKRVAVYRWIEGKEMDGREDYEYFYKLGKIAAKLHLATKDAKIPPHIRPKKWDKVFYYRGEVPVYKQEKHQKFLSREYHETMDFMIPYLDDKLKAYYKNSQPQLIHADLNPYNVLVHKKSLRLIDFEEAMWGLPVHDFAIALFYYRYDSRFDFGRVEQLFFDGYSSLNALPEFSEYDIELLIAARTVNFLNYVLLISDDPKEYVNRNIKRVKDFMKKYV